jgi:hypothetical protein
MTAVNRTLQHLLVKALGLVGSLVVLPFAVAGRRHHH